MSECLNIIPSPQYCDFRKGESLQVKKVCCEAKKTKTIGAALALLKKESCFELSDAQSADLIISNNPEEHFDEWERSFFKEKNAREQGYIIKKTKACPVILAANTDIGCAYGIMTILQVIGKEVAELYVRDWPDFRLRGNKWVVWAEAGIWSYDFGDGAASMKKRIERKLDMSFKYKMNAIYFDAFGLKTDRFSEYADIVRFANDRARERGITLISGTYGMSYGMQGMGNAYYQGHGYLNRKSYPDGEIYECIGTYDAWDIDFDKEVTDYSHRRDVVVAREHGTCMSNEALFEMKVAEMAEYITKTHCGALYLHNMDAHEIHPELWKARCEMCRQKWPNDDLFAKDGAAGAFAEYFSKLSARLSEIKDEDYDAAKDLQIMLISPGYLYSIVTSDEDYDTGMKFWSAVSDYLSVNNMTIGFREHFFYHGKDVRRAVSLEENDFKCDTTIINFSGGDGYYDDKIFTTTSALNYIMKGFDGMICANGNAFQEPLQVFNAEYLWNCDNSDFYKLEDKPRNQTEFVKLYKSAIASEFRPAEIYGEGVFLDIICEKLYGSEIGTEIAKIYKLYGSNGEPPVACASAVDLYTNYSRIIFPMRWDNKDINAQEIAGMTERFKECSIVSAKASDIMGEVLKNYCGDAEMEEDLIWLSECFEMGSKLTKLLYGYMRIYSELDAGFANSKEIRETLVDEINDLRAQIECYIGWVENSGRKAIDKLGGSLVRRKEMGEQLEYWTSLMLSSIKTNKRIPDDAKPLPTKNWW